MRAADPVAKSSSADVVHIDSHADHHPTPVYAKHVDDNPATITAAFDIDLRAWPTQLVQWLVIFGALGVMLGGAKWWIAHQFVEPSRLVASSIAIAPMSRAGAQDIGAEAPPDDSTSPVQTQTTAPTARDPAVAAATEMSARIPVTVGDEPRATEVPAATVDAPIVRAPAEVPYPRRTYNAQPQVPGSAIAKSGIVILSVLIDTVGNVTEVESLRSLDPAHDAAAIVAARLWKFEPTMHRGRPVAVRGNFTVRFGY